MEGTPDFARALDETRAYLASAEARASLDADPYWPKWHSPWWRMLLLHELGLGAEIPLALAEAFARKLASHCLPTFPFREEDVPAGVDPIRGVACHCQLGTAVTVLASRGVDVDALVPWARGWFPRYQLPDGGLNCDEAAYLKATPRSSIVSTLPALEAVLLRAGRDITPEEVHFLDRGAQYLLARRLWRSVSKGGAPIDASFARPCFPRFYFYDVLRGLRFLVRWARAFDRRLPPDAVAEAVAALDAWSAAPVPRAAIANTRTRLRAPDGTWTKGPATSFPLLDLASSESTPSPWLAREWAATRAELERVAR